MKAPSLTIGIEEEYQIIDPQTRELSSYITQILQEGYMGVKQDMQELAQRLLIFGTHVHVGIEDREFLIDAMNVVRYLLPHVLCLSSSSPFWMGRTTGLKSYRSIIFRNFPRSGIPRTFQSWADFSSLVETLVNTNAIPNGTKIWWDVRPNWTYPTL